jgi:hypothetical protein
MRLSDEHGLPVVAGEDLIAADLVILPAVEPLDEPEVADGDGFVIVFDAGLEKAGDVIAGCGAGRRVG